VQDDGPGVAPEAVADLAERTFRDDPARPRGQGLGLAIADEVCRRAGWTISYANREEGGLEVVVRGGRG
jgi:two-component system sensor histidine kinase QseC